MSVIMAEQGSPASSAEANDCVLMESTPELMRSVTLNWA